MPRNCPHKVSLAVPSEMGLTLRFLWVWSGWEASSFLEKVVLTWHLYNDTPLERRLVVSDGGEHPCCRQLSRRVLDCITRFSNYALATKGGQVLTPVQGTPLP